MYRPQEGWLTFFAKLACALAAMGLALWWLTGDPQGWLKASASAKVARLSLLVALGMAIYFATLALLGFRLRHFARRGAG